MNDKKTFPWLLILVVFSNRPSTMCTSVRNPCKMKCIDFLFHFCSVLPKAFTIACLQKALATLCNTYDIARLSNNWKC